MNRFRAFARRDPSAAFIVVWVAFTVLYAAYHVVRFFLEGGPR